MFSVWNLSINAERGGELVNVAQWELNVLNGRTRASQCSIIIPSYNWWPLEFLGSFPDLTLQYAWLWSVGDILAYHTLLFHTSSPFSLPVQIQARKGALAQSPNEHGHF